MPTKDDTPEVEVTAEDLLGVDDGSAPRPVDLAAALDAEDAVEEPRLHPILTNEEFRAAQKKAMERVDKETRAAAMKRVEDETVERIRGKAGQITNDPVKDEMVELMLDLPEYMPSLSINGVQYLHGAPYRVPRHVAETLREMQNRGWNHQNELDGKNMAERSRLQPRNTIMGRDGGVIAGMPQAVL